MSKPLHVFVIAGEHSGDQLGFKLMQALRAQTGGAVVFSGVGGPAMEGQGLQSLFPLSDIAVMGFSAVIPRLPTLIARVRATVRAAIDAKPDILVIIDSPDFTHAVAKRVRKKLPTLPVVDYVSPSVWAWRAGHFDRISSQALLPMDDDDFNVTRPWETAAQRAERVKEFGPTHAAATPGVWGGTR